MFKIKKLGITLSTIFLYLGLGSNVCAELPRDKQLHFNIGIPIGIISSKVGPILEDIVKGKEESNLNYYTRDELRAYRKKELSYGIKGAIFVAASKEIIYDGVLKKGTPEFLDFYYTVLSGTLSSLALFAFQSILDDIYEKYYAATTYSSINHDSLNHHTLDQKLNYKNYGIGCMINLKEENKGVKVFLYYEF